MKNDKYIIGNEIFVKEIPNEVDKLINKPDMMECIGCIGCVIMMEVYLFILL